MVFIDFVRVSHASVTVLLFEVAKMAERESEIAELVFWKEAACKFA